MQVEAERIAILKANIGGLPDSKIDFAKSLLTQYDRKKQLSDKQWFWVDKLADMAQGIPDFTAPTPEKVGALTGLHTLFQTAAKKLKHPGMILQLQSGDEVRLSRAGDHSKNPGHIYVKLPDTIGYAGKVDPEGQFFPVSKVDDGTKTALTLLLREMARHPAEAAAKYGKLTGRCCFCSKHLEDEKSTSVGYGPVCAKNWGLPWGSK